MSLSYWFFAQIFKTAKELDLGCGAGGGKNIKDIFKVGADSIAKENVLFIIGLTKTFTNLSDNETFL